MLLTIAEWAAANAGKSVLHHLGLLALAEDEHIELGADISEVLRAAGKSLGGFYGRDTSAYSERCADIETHLRAQILAVRQALGRPDGGPTTD